jgi:hypothetical protein
VSAPNPAAALPKPPPDRPAAAPPIHAAATDGVRFDDRLLMVAGSVGFGLVIPWLAGLFGPHRPPQALG